VAAVGVSAFPVFGAAGECDAVGEAGDSGFDLADDRDWFRSSSGLGLRRSLVLLSTCWLLPQ